MLKSIVLIVAIGATAFIYTDIESQSAFYGVALPLVVVLSFIAMALWLVVFFHKRGVSQTTNSRDGGFGGFDGGGGDC